MSVSVYLFSESDFSFTKANRSGGHLDRLEGEVSEVTSLLKDNVDRVLTRGDKLDDIQQKAVTVKPWENSSSSNSGSHGNKTFRRP
ncbi:hypothetical protein FSP39_004423 [Pinctada imbricata]|uniref:V-SNARE coiled-coil homology domain-containing protein n=1 Tax=Pinctada imbricata TaxID=66713 RepID=A0AA89C6G2_PINIB|nr:hypothetical protein FSP39_004423 [Pinctada imbricata]